MKKLILIAITCTLLISCNHSKDNAEIRKINIPTAATTGALYPLGSSMAELWNKEIEDISVTAQASNGGIDNLNLLQKGEAQITMANANIAYDSYHGKGLFEGRENKNLRVLAALYLNPNQVVVKKEISDLKDLKGKSFASGAPGSTTESETAIHLKAAGIAYPEDLNIQFVGFTEAIDLMRNKQLDGAWIMAGVPTAAVTEIITTSDAKILPISDEIISELKDKYPWYAEYIIPAGTYKDQGKDIKTTAVKLLMLTDAEMSDELVYSLTKSFWENIEDLKLSNKALKYIKVEEAIDDIAGLPLHSGAERYYDEIIK
ncbi:MAG: TAXI family TRAP transporter solute-binding subunit [Tissierellia bacterium]|nr:TAXI family TRAP transporter solute-binding subunit [Tissierellia bacterium]